MLHWSLPPARVKSLFYTEFVLHSVCFIQCSFYTVFVLYSVRFIQCLFYTGCFFLYRVLIAVQSFWSRTAFVGLNRLEHETLVELFTLYFFFFFFFCKQVSLAFQSLLCHML